MTSVEKIEEFLREQMLRWLGHIEKIDHERAPVKQKVLWLMVQKEADSKKAGKRIQKKTCWLEV